jgi:hypothetical protein
LPKTPDWAFLGPFGPFLGPFLGNFNQNLAFLKNLIFVQNSANFNLEGDEKNPDFWPILTLFGLSWARFGNFLGNLSRARF